MSQVSAQVSVTTGTAVLLWQTTTGVSPDPAVAHGSQIFLAGTNNLPIPILIINHDATNPIYIGGSGVTSSTGTRVAAGGSFSYGATGNDSMYAVATGSSVTVGVCVGGQ